MLRWNGKLLQLNGGLVNYTVPPTPPGPPFVQYNYTTFKSGGYGNISWDPIGGTYKYFDNSYSTDLTTGISFQTNGGSGDWPNFDVSQGNIYEFVWSEQDLQSTFNNGLAGNSSTYESGSNYGTIGYFATELYSIDFLHGSGPCRYSFPNVTIIPQDYRNIHNGESLTRCDNMFNGAPITNSIEAFILAMQQACPNLIYTSGCFAGCTTAPDYNYCLATYPNWF